MVVQVHPSIIYHFVIFQVHDYRIIMPQHRPATVVIVFFIVSLATTLWLCSHLIFSQHRTPSQAMTGPMQMLDVARIQELDSLTNYYTLVVYTGRWKFLRVLFPYIYRELRRNATEFGVLDRVVFMMLNYDKETYDNLLQLVKIANEILKQEVFQLNFMGYTPGKPPPQKDIYKAPYYELLFPEIIASRSSNKYFKMDDDIVYIHPGTFKNMIESKNSSQCFLHFANIVTNWRCNVKHQELGVYKSSKEVNPKNLKFEFSPSANCGWKSFECAELTLRTFLHHYHAGQLDKYQFEGLELLHRRKRFSINLFMLDKDVINIKSMLESGSIPPSDEQWWTVTYAGKFKQPNCIVGGGLVVHFAFRPSSGKMLQLGLLNEFELIVQKEVGALMEKELWDVLKFDPLSVLYIGS